MLWLPLILSLMSFPILTFGQSVKYVSDLDQSLNIKTVLLAPLVDNISGIYATPLNEALKNSIEASHQWETKPLDKSALMSPEEFEASPSAVKSAAKKSTADALIAGRISRGPNGVTIKLTLFSCVDGLPIGSETLNNYPGFEIADLKIQTSNLMKLLRGKLPYHGLVMSRKGQLVTLNIGAGAGIRPGFEATVIQVFKINRHPKFGFIVSTDNLTLGKIQINKVDEYLSFGTITSERETNVIASGSKVSFGNTVQYPNSNVMSDGKLITNLNDRADNQLAFGDKPREWLPETPPTFGKIGLMAGLGTYTISNGLTTGAVSGNSLATPSIHLNGELWMSPRWALGVTLRDYLFSIANGLSSSTPSTLSASFAETAIHVNYNFLLTDDFFGPKFQTGIGYSTMSTYIDNSAPTAFESTTYSGLFIHLGGAMPLGTGEEKFPFIIGGHLNYFLSPRQAEAPTNSGNAGNTQVNSFAITCEKRYSERVTLRGELMFDSMSTSFSGTGSRAIPSSSSSQSFTTFAGGVDFLF